MTVFARYACWGAGETAHFIRIEALEGDPAIFFSVHLPFRTLDVAGGSLSSPTEQAVLEALQSRRHAVSLFEGEPGSGKSHLIRWLKMRWRARDRDHLVLVPRSDGSLQGTLERLRRELGPPYAAPLEGLGRIDQLGQQGRAEAFLGQLITFCRSSSYAAGEKLPVHAEWLDQHEVWKFLNHIAVREEWSAPRDIVRLLTGAEGKRDQESARFTPAHVAALARVIRTREGSGHVRGFGLRAQRLYVDLHREAELVDRVVAEAGGDVDAQQRALADGAPNTIRVVEALNGRSTDAIQGFLGIQRNELQNRFLDVRRALGRDQRRLVLFLEDITNLQGVDLQLIEALLPNVETEGNADLCELVAILGVTPSYYQQAIAGLGNIIERLFLHLRLTAPERNVVNSEAALLKDEQSRLQFVATYLNAVRFGRDRVERWYQAQGPDAERPNVCAECPYRVPCHATFSAIEVPGVGSGPVGLYPLSRAAAQRFWEQLRDPTVTRTLHTPRGLLFNVVSEMLAGREALQNGNFPSSEIEGANLEAIAPSAELHDVLARVEDRQERDRLQRTVVWWRETEDMDGRRRKAANGTMSYSGVPQGVMGAFAVPWPGEGVVEPLPVNSAPAPKQTQEVRLESPHPPPDLPPVTPPPVTPPAPVRAGLSPGWSERLKALDRWRDGEPLEYASDWESLAYEALAEVGAELGCSPQMWYVLFTKENVILAGHTRRTALQLELPREAAVHLGLTALAWLRHGQGLDRLARLRRLTEAAAFQAWLADKARAHHDAKFAELMQTLGGDPVDLAVRSLLVGAWLAGTADPARDSAAQWVDALAEGQASTAPRTTVWNDLVKAWDDRRAALREIIGQWARVGQEPRSGPGLVDPARIHRAASTTASVLETGWPKGEGDFPRKLELLPLLRELVLKLREGICAAVRAEDEQLRMLCRTMRDLTGGQDADAFLPTVETEVEELRAVGSDLVPNVQYHQLLEALKKLKDAGLRGGDRARVRAVDDAAFQLADAPDEVPLADRLARVRSVDAQDLSLVVAAVTSAALTVDATHKVAKGLVDAMGQRTDLAALHAAAKRMTKAGDALLAEPETTHD